LGFDEFWVVEDCFSYGGPTAAATALASTERVQIGIGLLPALGRNPMFIATELGALATLYPRRLSAAFGHGVREWMVQVGIEPSNRLTALEEVVRSVRPLLTGERLTFEGQFVRLRDARLDAPPSQPPNVLVGTTGPRAMDIAARHADGLVMPEGSGENAIAAARAKMCAAEIVVYAWFRVEHDGDDARRTMCEVISRWRDWGLYPRLLQLGDIATADPISATDAAKLSIVGTPRECADCLRRLVAAGASTVVVMPVGEGFAAQLEMFAHAVWPLAMTAS
jgi:5,10-methylenetetrahydromethanopterin reductase